MPLRDRVGCLVASGLALACLSGRPLSEAATLGWGERAIEEDRSVATVAPGRFREPGRVETFRVVSINTGEVFDVELDGEGRPTAAGLTAAPHQFRAVGPGGEGPIAPALLTLLGKIARATGKPIELVSAYRPPTHAADENFHRRGEAADIRVEKVTTEDLAALAARLGARGIGIYPVGKMVHVDVRERPYRWVDTSAPEGEGL